MFAAVAAALVTSMQIMTQLRARGAVKTIRIGDFGIGGG